LSLQRLLERLRRIMTSLWRFDNSYARLPERFYARVNPTRVEAPTLIRINAALAETLGLDHAQLARSEYAQIFAGNSILEGSEPISQAYAGHQFGHFVPSLGDGRAILLGEHLAPDGRRFDIQLKGSGKTPFSRRGDGRAALGSVMREYIIGEALHALGIPTTRSLAFVTTGESVMRETPLPGAVLTRVASSHIRVGTFEYFSAKEDLQALKVLADYVIARHYPYIAQHPEPYSELCRQFMQRQIELVTQWLWCGFVHGVLNTDNVALSGESIDFGPCAFIDTYDPDTVFSSIDQDGRYAYGSQAGITQWNLARFFEALLALVDSDLERAVDKAQGLVEEFPRVFRKQWLQGMRKKLGLNTEEAEDLGLVEELLNVMRDSKLDYTNTFRSLTTGPRGVAFLQGNPRLVAWFNRWRERLDQDRNRCSLSEAMQSMRQHNPAYIPRNYRVEEAITAGVERADFSVMDNLMNVLSDPYRDRAETEQYAKPPPTTFVGYRTFCGT
jgi:uncharacterized protein YdiU (UPF0061 family)